VVVPMVAPVAMSVSGRLVLGAMLHGADCEAVRW
jgi:hypothetical protein